MQHQTFKEQLEEVEALFTLAGHLTLQEYAVNRILEILKTCTKLGCVKRNLKSGQDSVLVEINTTKVTEFKNLIADYAQEFNIKVNPKKLYELAEVVLHYLTKISEGGDELFLSTFNIIKYMNNHYVLSTVSIHMLKAAGVVVIDGQSNSNKHSGL